MTPNKTLREASCADDYDPNSMPVERARALIRDYLEPVTAVERVHIRQALGRTLAADIVSPIDVPGARQLGDGRLGRALRGPRAPTRRRRSRASASRSPAGRTTGRSAPARRVRIFTGGVMPAGADTVVMQERADERDGRVTIAAGAVTKAGQNRRFAGEDLKAGGVVFRRGQALNARRGRHARVARRQRSAGLPTPRRRVLLDRRRAACRSARRFRPARSTTATATRSARMLARLGCEAIDMGVVRRRSRRARARVPRRGRERRRRDHVRRRVGRRGRLREAAAWTASARSCSGRSR